MAILWTAGMSTGICGADDGADGGAQHRAVDDGASGGWRGLKSGGKVLFISVDIQSI